MTDNELADFKQQLLTLRDSLMLNQKLGQPATDTVQLDQTSVGRVSRIDAIQSQFMAVETTRLRQQHLRQIVTALALVESGDYGFCSGCDAVIDPKRLAIDPAATFCVPCASRSE
jgi:DnaK suppressor protein